MVAPNFIDISSIIDSGTLTRIGFLIGILVVLWYILESELISVWATPEVEINHHRQSNYVEGKWVTQLEISNLEEVEITNCYATLEKADNVYWSEDGWKSSLLVPFLSNKPSRLIWDEQEESDEKCEITIPLKNSRYINVMDTSGGIHFNLCSNKKLEPNYTLGTKVCTFRIRIDGKFNNKGMRPLYFDGYVYHRIKPFHFKSMDLKNRDDVIEGNRYVPYVIFGKGDWTKDEEVKKDIEIERKEIEKWQEENNRRIEEMNQQLRKKD